MKRYFFGLSLVAGLLSAGPLWALDECPIKEVDADGNINEQFNEQVVELISRTKVCNGAVEILSLCGNMNREDHLKVEAAQAVCDKNLKPLLPNKDAKMHVALQSQCIQKYKDGDDPGNMKEIYVRYCQLRVTAMFVDLYTPAP